MLIEKLKLTNFLSYGSESKEIKLEDLNVLIGPNASGKSNLIEAIRLLRSIPTNLAIEIRRGGGIQDWLWKGKKETPTAEIEAVVNYPKGRISLRYKLSFTSLAQRFEIVDETIENEHAERGEDIYFFYRYQDGHPVLNFKPEIEEDKGNYEGRTKRKLRREDLNLEQSVISQRKDADVYPEITYLGNQFAGIRLYTDWTIGRHATPRMPQKTDEANDFLFDNAENLGLILSNLLNIPKTKKLIIEKFRELYSTAEDIAFNVVSGTIQLFIHEEGRHHPIPATRLSDGTLRYLSLLAILCHPSPPPLICIEEPEIGLHPDIMSTVAELLIDASKRTQIVVTTHSEALVSALTEKPEAVLICEQDENGSSLRRLDSEKLEKWLEDYSLGDLWIKGELGGTRW